MKKQNESYALGESARIYSPIVHGGLPADMVTGWCNTCNRLTHQDQGKYGQRARTCQKCGRIPTERPKVSVGRRFM